MKKNNQLNELKEKLINLYLSKVIPIQEYIKEKFMNQEEILERYYRSKEEIIKNHYKNDKKLAAEYKKNIQLFKDRIITELSDCRCYYIPLHLHEDFFEWLLEKKTFELQRCVFNLEHSYAFLNIIDNQVITEFKEHYRKKIINNINQETLKFLDLKIESKFPNI